MTKKIKQIRLENWERKILRRVFGGKQIELGLERRSNAEFYKLFRDIFISNFKKTRRMQSLGHSERMDQEKDVKSIAWENRKSRRKTGRPKKQ